MPRVPKQPAVIVPQKKAAPAAPRKTLVRKAKPRAPKTKLQVIAKNAAALHVRVKKMTSTPTVTSSPTSLRTDVPKIPPRRVRQSSTPKIPLRNQEPDVEALRDEVVTTPKAASERLVSKSKALTAWYNTQFGAYAARTAYAVGFVFIATAGSVLAAHTANQFSSWGEFQNAAICVTLPCESSPGTTATGAFPPLPGSAQSTSTFATVTPTVKFRTAPPETVQSNFEVIVAAENASEVILFVESRKTAAKTNLSPTAESTATELRFVIDPKRFQAGEYQLRASARASTGGGVVYATGGRFTISAAVQTDSEPPRATGTSSSLATATTPTTAKAVNSSTTATARNSSSTVTKLPPPPIGTDVVTAKPPVTTSTTPRPAITNDNLPRATNTPPMVVSDNPPKATTTQPVVAVKATPINLVIEAGLDMMFTAKIRAHNMASVEVFAERTQASQPFFLGNAVTFENGYWLLTFTAGQLPNGNYSVFARGTSNAGTITLSDRLPLLIHTKPKTGNLVPKTASTTTFLPPQTAIKVDDVKVERERYLSAPPPVVEKEFIAGTTTLALETERQQIVTGYVGKSLDTHEDAINTLLQRYASAYQSGDAELQVRARTELERKQKTIVTEALLDTDGKTAVAEIENSITIEFTKLQKRVEFFEELIKERSNSISTIDTDGDGISDYDEESLYKTDQSNPDSDGDGVNDGTEIVSGYDPSSAKAEALMVFDSPKGFGVVRADVLSIETIVPLVETDDTRGVPAVQAQIRGRGLPNSFVTLFIYSTPVVVTVKTDADGSFVYEFERELEDGNHEVYAAVTDNKGAIVAKSAPFSFIKQAQAFTPLSTTGEAYITSEPNSFSPVTNVFLVISSLVVLMFGLILIILGLMVRREPTIVATSDVSPVA